MKTTANNPKLVFTAGLPGAGKSYCLKKSEFAELPIVDPDEIKKSHPDYDPKNPNAIHPWSKKEARKMQLGFLSTETSFVIDGTGTNVDKYLNWFNEARELGYEIVVMYVKVKLETSIERNANRERNVPLSVIMEKANIIDRSMRLLGSTADEFIVVNND